MPAAVIGGIIAGAGAVGAAAIQSHAAGKAASQQKDYGEQALSLQRDVLAQQQANLAPWRNVGGSAITTLGGLLGLPSGGGGSAPMQQEGMTRLSDAGYSPAQANFDRYSPYGGYVGKDTPMSEQMSNPYVNLDASGRTAQQHGATASSYGGQTAPGNPPEGEPMLQVKAPNGQIYQVPASKAAEAQQNGGTVLGRA